MANFADGFDCYTAIGDPATYWDTVTGTVSAFPAGRFSGSRGISFTTSATPALVKGNGATDALHHIVVAVSQGTAITGTNLGLFFHLRDGATAQCSVVFRSDGAILLTSGIHTGTVLATYTGAVTAASTWFAFEIEVFISATAGYMNVRKNGNTVNDFTSATNLVTRGGTANPYANTLAVGQGANTSHITDDLYWRSDASSVAWMGDIRCYTRAPASDASVQFSRAPASSVTTTPAGSSASITNGQARYTQFTAAYDGTISTITVAMTTASTSNMKCSIFASSGTQPMAVLGSANVVANPTGVTAITFPSPITVVKGTQYWIGVANDATSGAFTSTATATGWLSFTAYASFPAANPGGSAQPAPTFSVTIGVTTNYGMVAEAQQDATTSYVYDSVPGHADLYGIAAIASTPLTTFAVTTRAYAIKSDAGTRTMAVQLKSGATTDASSTVVLTPSGWQWAWKTYTTDPATGAEWTAAAVNVANVGVTVVA